MYKRDRFDDQRDRRHYDYSYDKKGRRSNYEDSYEKKNRRSDDYEDSYEKKNHSSDDCEKESHNTGCNDAEVVQDADQLALIEQDSDELIYIKDSCNIEVHTTSTQAAVSLQVGLQLAIALVIKITIGDSSDGDAVVQDLLQSFDTDQSNKQKIIIENSKDVNVTTTDTDLAVNIQALLQVLVTLVAKLDVL